MSNAAAPTFDTFQRKGKPLSGAALWMAGILLAIANFVAILDMSIANVSVPNIAGALGVSVTQGTWVITSYAVAEAVCVPLTGWLAARFGSVRVFAIALLAFAATSALCGLAPNFEILVFGRVLQGFAGGPLMPLAQTLLLTIYPPKQRPIAMAIWAITTLTAPVAGPMLGGVLCDNFGWGSIFLVNIPVAIAAAILVWRMLFYYQEPTTKARVDFVGLGLLVLWVGAFQIMLDLGKDNNWFESPMIVTLGVVALLGFIAFLIWELTDKNPIVDLKIFRHKGYTIAMVILPIAFGAFFATNVVAPLWLQANLHYTATSAGYATGLIGVLAIFAAPVAAGLSQKFDARWVLIFGLSWLTIMTFARSFANTDLTFWQISLTIFLTGLGMPFFFMPLIQMSMAAVHPSETASASGLQNFVRTMAGAVATSFVTTQWENMAHANHDKLIAVANGGEQTLKLGESLGYSREQGLWVIDHLAESQGVMLATNTVFIGSSLIFFACVLMVFLLPKPNKAVDMSGVH